MNVRTIAVAVLTLGAPAASAGGPGLLGAVDYLESQGWREIEIRNDHGRITIEAERARGRQGWIYDSGRGRLAPIEARRDDHGDRRWVRFDDGRGGDDDDDDDDDDDRWDD